MPLSLLGALAGQESSSYANKRSDWTVLWDSTLAPLYSDMDDVINLSFRNEPQFRGLDELVFDLSDVKALQEDVDLVTDRARKNFMAGAWTLEEFRLVTGMDATAAVGTYYVPANAIPIPAGQIGFMPEPAQLAARYVQALASPPQLPEPARERVAEVRCPECNKLCARDVHEGEPAYCRRCKREFTVAGTGQVIATTRRQRVLRDEFGMISEIIDVVEPR